MLAAALAGLGPQVQAQQRPATGLAAELDRVIRQGMKDWEIPGLSVAVVRNDSTVLLRGYGVRRLGTPGMVDQQTLFGMMSTTKAFTSLALAMLVDDGVVSWDDPVSRWVPEFAMPDAYVTRSLLVRDLLTHSAGLGNADLLWVRQDLTDREIFGRIRLLTPAYPFRGGFIYQNLMYGLAGEVIARASGLGYGEFLRRRVFGPLGMTRTYASYAAVAALGDSNVSAPHYRIGGAIGPIPEETVDRIPAAGALWSTAADMASWVRFLLDSARVGGRRLVSDSSFAMLFAPHVMIGPDEFYPTAELTRPHWTSYGFGWFQQDYRGHFVAFHTGSLDGRTAIVGLIPDLGVGIYLFGNLDHAEFRHALMLTVFDRAIGGPVRDWNRELLALYRARRARGEAARNAAEAGRIAGTRTSVPLAEYAGSYVHPVWGDVVVELGDSGLRMRIGTNPELRGPLEHWHFDTFRARLGDGRESPGLVSFNLGADGRVSQLVLPDLGASFDRVR